MKKLLTSKVSLTKILAIALSLASTPVLAHTGHLPDESVHGLLHVEHVIAIAVIGFIAYFISVLRNK